MAIRNLLEEMGESFLFADGLDDALIGYVTVGGKALALYDKEKVITILTGQLESEEDAREWFDYNIEGAYVGESTPAFATFVGEHDGVFTSVGG